MPTFEMQDRLARADGVPGGVRESKRRATHRRITEEGIRLFLERGYDATTLDEIAAAAEISRRSFFAYFKSKDEILLTWQRSGWEDLLAEVRLASADDSPLQVIRHALSRRMAGYETAQLKAIARVMCSNETLQATRFSAFAEQEKTLFEVLCERWPEPERRLALRLVAMSAMGALRVAVERWEVPDNQRSLEQLFLETVDALAASIA